MTDALSRREDRRIRRLLGFTPAQERALIKALRRGRLMIAGGFGGSLPPALAMMSAEFDRRQPVEHLVRKRYLAPGEGANTFVPTELGRARLRALLAARREAEAKKEAAHAQGSPPHAEGPAGAQAGRPGAGPARPPRLRRKPTSGRKIDQSGRVSARAAGRLV